MTAPSHKLQGTPLGTLLDMGLSNQKIGDISGVQPSGVSKWRTGANTAGVARQMRAKGYLDGLSKSPKPAAVEAPPPAPAKPAAVSADPMFLVSVPPAQTGRFTKMMALLALDYVDLDA